MRRNDIPRISAASFAECVVSWDFGRAHFPGAVVRLASGQFHHMLVRLLLISRLLVQTLTYLWVHSLARSQISPSFRRLVPWSTPGLVHGFSCCLISGSHGFAGALFVALSVVWATGSPMGCCLVLRFARHWFLYCVRPELLLVYPCAFQ
jgi:hypothetical protein